MLIHRDFDTAIDFISHVNDVINRLAMLNNSLDLNMSIIGFFDNVFYLSNWNWNIHHLLGVVSVTLLNVRKTTFILAVVCVSRLAVVVPMSR